MSRSLIGELGAALRGIGAAIRARMLVFALVTAAVFAMDIAAPPLLLSLVRKPIDYYSANPLLKTVPEYVISGRGAIGERLDKAWNLSLFSFSASNPYGLEWGVSFSAADLARFVLTSLLVGAYFALWVHRRSQLSGDGWGLRSGGPGGMVGAVWSGFGLATGGCTVTGCGAPVMPVVGLAFAGLSSGTIKWMSGLSSVGTAAVLLGLAAGVLYFGWRVGTDGRSRHGPRPSETPVAVATLSDRLD